MLTNAELDFMKKVPIALEHLAEKLAEVTKELKEIKENMKK